MQSGAEDRAEPGVRAMRCCVYWVAFSLVAAPAGAQAETFFIEDGTVVEGSILRSLGNTVTIKRDEGGMFQLPLGAIDRIEIAADNGELVTGSLAWWAANVYVVVTSEGLVEIKDGVIKKVSETGQTPSAVVEEPRSEPELDADQNSEAPAPAAKSLIDEETPQKLEPTM